MNTVVFDLGNVLVDYNGGVCVDMLGYTGEVKKELIHAIFLSDAWKAGDEGSVTPEEQLTQFINNAPHLEKEIRDVYEHLDGSIRKFDYTEEVLAHFRKAGFKLYYLSNYGEYLFEKTKYELDFLRKFDGGIISYREKLMKPQKEIYNLLMTRYNIKPNDAWFIDDRPENVEAANAVGMHGIVFDSHTVEEILTGKYTGGQKK